ncbi:hypothetical protein [Pseudomonas frederiksbergensis]|uniref:hypothetical protein n=1 Tax=Pseudomonas frederiksbergensis TaxID=104087 RepID=UPI003D1A0635
MVEDQKIALRQLLQGERIPNVGAAEGCDLLTLLQKQQSRSKAALLVWITA